MDLPRPSNMDPWAIDMAFGSLIIYAGYSLRRAMASLDRTLTRMEKDLKSFSELFREKYESLEHRLTVVETACNTRYGRDE